MQNGDLTIFFNNNNIKFKYSEDKRCYICQSNGITNIIKIISLYEENEQFIKDKKHWLKLVKTARDKGVTFLLFFEDELYHKKEICFSRIKNYFKITENKIYARECVVKEIDAPTSKKFIDANHIQGSSPAKIKLGLFYKDELVSAMTFQTPRVALGAKKDKILENEFELLRFVTKMNTSVIGGASKLLKYFENNHNPSKIRTYADLRFGTGDFYVKQLGFEKQKSSEPCYFYVNKQVIPMERKHRFGFRKNVLSTKLKTFDESLTEVVNCSNNGYFRIFDLGNCVFQKLYKCQED